MFQVVATLLIWTSTHRRRIKAQRMEHQLYLFVYEGTKLGQWGAAEQEHKDGFKWF